MRILTQKIAYLILLIVIGYSSAFAQWVYSHYGVYPDIMRDCEAVDSNTFWAVGSFGYVIKSTDSGRTWSQFSYAHLTSDLYQVDFPDAKHGFAASGPTGSTTIIATSDSGNTWRITRTQLPLDWICGLEFADSLSGFVAGSSTIYRTADGGTTWLAPDSFPNGFYAGDLFMLNRDTLWASGAVGNDPYFPKVANTYDGGRTWRIKYSFGDTLHGWGWVIAFSDPRHGWVVASSALTDTVFLYSTTDGGDNWNLIYSFFDGTSINEYENMVVFDSLNLRIAGEVNFAMGKIKRSTDGGYSWIDEFYGGVGAIYGFSMSDTAHGLVVGGPIWDNTPLILYYNGAVGIDNNFIKPEAFNLSAYPNPFNSTTIISFSNLKDDEIKIFDIKGSLVRILRPE
jgi:photosystem II stability/assembly factor-like uncharacterized protein